MFLKLSIVRKYSKTKKAVSKSLETAFLVSLLSDSNQRPRDYKSRALAN